MAKPPKLRVQEGASSLAVRISSSLAKQVGFEASQPAAKPILTLTQKLELFDPQRHGGEAMVTEDTGHESA